MVANEVAPIWDKSTSNLVSMLLHQQVTSLIETKAGAYMLS